MTALEAEVAEYIERFGEVRDADGRRLVVRNGQAQERTVTCGAGTWQVRAPRVNDKRVDADGARERFTSRILPPYMRRSPQVSEVARPADRSANEEAWQAAGAQRPGGQPQACRRRIP